jgi:hypothetical protein
MKYLELNLRNVQNLRRKHNQAPVAHTYNSSYLRDWDQEDHSSTSAWEKKVVRPYFNGKKNLGMVACACHPSNGGKPKIGLQSRPAWAKSKTLSLN